MTTKLLFFLPALGVLAAAQSQTPRYTVIDLGTFGGASAAVYGVNATGRAAGAAAISNGNQHAYLTGIEGTKYDLGTLGGANSTANGLNAGATLAIESETAQKDPFGNDFCGFGTNHICVPAVWNGTMTPLPLPGGNNGVAFAPNDRGQISGMAETAVKDSACAAPQTLQYEAILWGPNPGQMQVLPPLPGDTVGFTFAPPNSKGQVVGSSGTCDTTPLLPVPFGPHAVLWDNGTATALPNLGGAMVGVGATINDAGTIVGGSDLPSENPGFPFVQIHMTMWNNGVPKDLGTVGTDFSSLPTWLNNHNQIVGSSCDDQGNCRAFLWQNGQMVDLNSLIPANSPLYLVFAESINDAGTIVGNAVNTVTGDMRAFMAIPARTSAATASFEADELRVTTPLPLPQTARTLLGRRLWRGR